MAASVTTMAHAWRTYIDEGLMVAHEVDAALKLAPRLADALLEIVGQPWTREEECHRAYCACHTLFSCPQCGLGAEPTGHSRDCAWLIAARALGIA